eukprot:Nitzschia sp. Nitz4//scaffold66_size103028//94881//96508//NITZ4_004516-RA/size103028-processed-gene-0.17-mRNA-1//1//CDS//3329556404//9462//frame0
MVGRSSNSQNSPINLKWYDHVFRAAERENYTLEGLQPDASQNEMESGLAKAMNSLSLEERATNMEEIHGVSPELEETPEKLDELIETLVQELEKIEVKEAYEEGLQQNREYLESRWFRLMFLRSTSHDPSQAASRIVTFMEKKKKIFGAHTLGRSLTFEDLNKDDTETLRNAANCLLPTRDQAGRLVFLTDSFIHPKGFVTSESLLRSYLYLMLSAVEDEDTQKRGVVFILWYLGELILGDFESDVMEEFIFCALWIPVRIVSIHYCCDTSLVKRIVLRLFRAISAPQFRYKYQCHEGTSTENLYSLMSFGIPVDTIQLNSDGRLRMTNSQKKWITKQRSKEAACRALGGSHKWQKLDIPTRRDVLAGKGKSMQDFPGTVFMRTLIEKYSYQYARSATNVEKAKVRTGIVEAIRASGGRFLKRDETYTGWWTTSNEKEIQEKMQKAFSAQSASRRVPATNLDVGPPLHKRPRNVLSLDTHRDPSRCFGLGF